MLFEIDYQCYNQIILGITKQEFNNRIILRLVNQRNRYSSSQGIMHATTILGHPPAYYPSHQSTQLILEMSPYRYYAICAIIVAVFGGWQHVWGWVVAYLAASLVFSSYVAVRVTRRLSLSLDRKSTRLN